jgi:hypothetical protein
MHLAQSFVFPDPAAPKMTICGARVVAGKVKTGLPGAANGTDRAADRDAVPAGQQRGPAGRGGGTAGGRVDLPFPLPVSKVTGAEAIRPPILALTA